MVDRDWSAEHFTDSARCILELIPAVAGSRWHHIADPSSIVMMSLWFLLLWQRKIGRVALEEVGVEPYDLARDLDQCLEQKALANPGIVMRRGTIVYVRPVDFDALLEPLIRQSEHEAIELGHNYVGSEHLVLAMIRLADPELLGFLQKRSVTYERVKDVVLKLLYG